MSDENNITIQDEISGNMLMYDDILSNTEITSDEHKEAFRNFAKCVELFISANKAGSENDLAWARFEDEKLKENEAKSERRKEIARFVLDISAIVAPIIAGIIKQKSGQRFAAREMDKMCYYEENGTLRSYPGKTAWKMVENEARG